MTSTKCSDFRTPPLLSIFGYDLTYDIHAIYLTSSAFWGLPCHCGGHISMFPNAWVHLRGAPRCRRALFRIQQTDYSLIMPFYESPTPYGNFDESTLSVTIMYQVSNSRPVSKEYSTEGIYLQRVARYGNHATFVRECRLV